MLAAKAPTDRPERMTTAKKADLRIEGARSL
jgi:hypothetical protein